MLKSLSPIDVALIKKIGGTSGSITVDSELSDTSTNPVQNKVIKSALDSLSEEIVDDVLAALPTWEGGSY